MKRLIAIFIASLLMLAIPSLAENVAADAPGAGGSSVQPYMISHAMGGIDGQKYSNCLEAFLENYAEGHRVFEVDFELTSDGALVLWHDWDIQFCSDYEAGYQPTHAEFLASRIFDRYTPMDLEALLRLMGAYPDVTFITDTKYYQRQAVRRQFIAIVDTAQALGLSDALDRFVVQVYSPEMLRAVEGVHDFDNYILTLYKLYTDSPTDDELRSVAEFCANSGVDTVAMFTVWWRPEFYDILASRGLNAALYTSNNTDEAAGYLAQGVVALYTDFLPPIPTGEEE